jgi:hypothetical protein
MSRLGDDEASIIGRLATATISGSPVFKVIRGFSGGWRPVLREHLYRELMPAAYVSFLDELTAPETHPYKQGPVFAVLIATRLLRPGQDPRLGGGGEVGALTAIDKAKDVLDNYTPTFDKRITNIRIRFVDGDDRVAAYELLYRVWPILF